MMSVDKNPRAVYEAVQAGLPVFVASEAQCATDLMKQPFAVETSIIAALSDTRQFNQDMRSFVGMIGRDWSWDMATWARAEMTDESVYQGLCQRMGVCQDGKKVYDPWFGPDHDKQKPIKALRKPPSRATLMHRPVTQYLPPDSKYPLPVIHTVDTEKAQARQRDRKRAAERKRVVEKVQFSGGDEDEDEDEPQARDPTADDNMVDRLDSEEQDASSSQMGLADEDYSSSDEEGAGLATPRRMLREPALSDSATQWMTEEFAMDVIDPNLMPIELSFYEEDYDLDLFDDYLGEEEMLPHEMEYCDTEELLPDEEGTDGNNALAA